MPGEESPAAPDGVGLTFPVEFSTARAWTDAQMEALFAEGFPEFIVADRSVKDHIGRVRELFPHLDVVLVDHDEPVATGWGVPIAWNETAEDLPDSFADILRRSLDLHDSGGTPNTFVIGGAVVHPSYKGRGTAAALLDALCDLADTHDLACVLAPARPTKKHLYPLQSIEQYAAWVRSDGLPFDPWLRLHVRIGGVVIGLSPQAQTMTGTPAEWESWTGLKFPTSGDYVIPEGMGLLHIDLSADTGVYVEPNIWVRHR